MKDRKKQGALALVGIFTASSVMATSGGVQVVFAKNKTTLQVAQDYVSYLTGSLKKNYLGKKNLPLFNETLSEAKAAVAKLPKGDVKNKLSASVSRSEAIIRATEAVVKLEDSMARNSNVMKNVPTFEIYLNAASGRIGKLTHSETQDAKDKLSERIYKMFNNIRDIKVKNTSPYAYAYQLYLEGKMFHNLAKENPKSANVKLADDKISDALNAIWKITTSAIKDKLRDEVKALLKLQSQMIGSTLPQGGGSGNGGTGNSTSPQILLAGNVYMNTKLNEKYKEPGFAAIDDGDGIITIKVKVTFMNILTGDVYDTLPVDKSAIFQVRYSVSDSNKNETTSYRFIAVGDAKLPGISIDQGGNGSGNGNNNNNGNNNGNNNNGGGSGSSTDKEAPVITINGYKSGDTIPLDFKASFTNPTATAKDNKDGNITPTVKVEKFNGTRYEQVSNVNTSIEGMYRIIYTAKDKAGNEATATLNVIVRGESSSNKASIDIWTVDSKANIHIDPKKAIVNNINSPDAYKIYWYGSQTIDGLSITASSSGATLSIKGDGKQLEISQSRGVATTSESLSKYATIEVRVDSSDKSETTYYYIYPTEVKTDSQFIEAIKKVRTSGEVYKLFKGKFGDIVSNTNEWGFEYAIDAASKAPGVLINQNGNTLYDENKQAISVPNMSNIKDIIYGANQIQINGRNKTASTSVVQETILNQIKNYIKEGTDKDKQIDTAKAKLASFLIAESNDGKDINVYEQLMTIAGIKRNDILFDSNLLNEKLNDFYKQAVTSSVRSAILSATIGLDNSGTGTLYNFKTIITEANDLAVKHVINSIENFDVTKGQDEFRTLLENLVLYTSHRKDEADKMYVFKEQPDVGNDGTVATDTFVDVNFAYYKEDMKAILSKDTKKRLEPKAVYEALNSGNAAAAKDDFNSTNGTVVLLRNAITSGKADDVVAVLSSTKIKDVKIIDRLVNDVTKKYKAYSEDEKKEVAERLIKIAKNDPLTIKKLIKKSKTALGDSTSSVTTNDNLLEYAMKFYDDQKSKFNNTFTEVLAINYDQNYDASNETKWVKQREDAINAINNNYISKVASLGGGKPPWNVDHKVAHFIINRSKITGAEALVNKLKSATTIAGIDEAMKVIITEAAKIGTIPNGPDKPVGTR